MDAANLCSLIEQFGSEDKCRAYLEALRWPDEIMCPRCQSGKISQIVKRNQFDCDSCRYQFSVTAGTVFNDSHLPMWKWFLCVYLLCESKKSMSANQLKRILGVSYKTAWYLCHRVRAAMKETTLEPLGGIVKIDETYIGGETHRADLDVIMADEWVAYPKAMMEAGIHGTKHQAIKHKDGIYVDGNITTDGIGSAFSLLKRGIVGSWHTVSSKHLAAYLDEMTFRFNNRSNPYLFRDTLMKLIEAPVLEYKKLTAA